MDLSLSGLAARALRSRRLMRAPIGLYRRGWGALLGERIMMLEHRGRSSGLRRYVCLEVVERPGPKQLVIVSAFGERAQWFQNLQAHPRCVVSSGRIRRAPATARFMSDDEAAATLARYIERRPRDWAVLKAAMEKALGHPVDELPMVELSLD